MKTLFGTILAASLMLTTSAQAAVIQFNLDGNAGTGLLGGNENPAVVGGGSGGEFGSGISFDTVSNELTINIAWGSGNGFTDLTGDLSALHLHGATASAPTGFSNNAGVLVGLNGLPEFNGNAVNGSLLNAVVTLSAPQAAALQANQTYLNGHTAANPGGEIRGHLVAAVAAIPAPASLLLMVTAFAGLRRKKR